MNRFNIVPLKSFDLATTMRRFLSNRMLMTFKLSDNAIV